ncbi:MAG: hypothetical protein ACR2NS_14255 [Gemmatimonadaceae bacterium]
MRPKRPLVIAIVLLVACKPPTPAQQMDSIQSWLATAEMVGQAWLRHTTPDKYSRQTLELSRETLAQISSDLLASLPPATDSAKLDAVLLRSRVRLDQMARLIESKNSPDFRRQLDSLAADKKIVEQISDGMPKQ